MKFKEDIFKISSYFDENVCFWDFPYEIEFVSQDNDTRVAEANDTLFATNPILISLKQIVYNQSLLETLKFTTDEIAGLIAHEIGHLIRGKHDSNDLVEEEINCDKYASDLGLDLALSSALIKISESLTVIGLKERLNLLSQAKLFRPEWTCGRYDKKGEVAIFYNLIEGISYFFESYSAMVIGEILAVPRNGVFCIDNISKKLNIAQENLILFFKKLEQLGLISSASPTEDAISKYRNEVCKYNQKRSLSLEERSTKEKLPYAISNAERLYTEKAGGITSVMFELTYRCSEKCIHCYNIGATRNEEEENKRGNREELTLGEYKKLIDDLYELGLVKVCLTGGDPFSKSFVWEIIDYLYNKGIAFDVFTNGQCILKDCKKLANYYPRLVGVSIYSGIEETHDYITRVKGSWERSMEVIRQLSSLAVPLNIKCCIMRPNVKSYFMVTDIAKQYGAVPQFELNITDSIEGDTCASKYLRMTPEQLEIVLRDENTPMYVGQEAPNYGGQKKVMDQNPCGAGENSLCITPDGNVIPCCAYHLRFGNIREDSISYIIHNSEKRNYWLGLSLNDYEECGKLDYCDYCNLCPGNNFIEHETPIKASEVNCYMAKARFELAKKMQQGYDPLQGNTVRERLAELPEYVPIAIQREMSQSYSDMR